MRWSPIQERALNAISEWLKSKPKTPFYLAGYAGTGKSTLALEIASTVKGKVEFGAFTGKAAYVLQQKGCTSAKTIHSLIYKPADRSKEALRHLEDELTQLLGELRMEIGPEDRHTPEALRHLNDNPLVVKLKKQIEEEKQGLKKPMFALNTMSDLRHAALYIVDECSMIDQKMGEDIMSFEVPVLVLGDPAQLPPVKGTGYFINRKPDMLLTEIHRQARDNPIIQMATLVREGEKLELGDYGESRVITMDEGEKEMYLSHDQIICGREKKPEHRSDPIYRGNLNRRVRQIKEFPGLFPVPGDKLVCLKNHAEEGLLNGSLWQTVAAEVAGDDVVLSVRNEEGRVAEVVAHAQPFRGEEIPYYEIKEKETFDFGYAMTCHKSQGSQWDSVLIFDQSGVFRENARKWLYTAITRAAKRVTVIRC